MAFRMMYDALTKSKLLLGIYEEIGEMNRVCKGIFEDSYDCLLNNLDERAAEISDEDKVINKYEVSVRSNILKYLAVNRAPDLGAALVMTSVATGYERIGDYCKGIAGLGLRYPSRLEEKDFVYIVQTMRDTITEQFDLALESYRNSEIENANKVLESYGGVKVLHDSLIHKLNEVGQMNTNTAIVYASLGIYLRRTSAHLRNICTAVVNPYPLFGHDKDPFRPKR